MPYQSTLRYRGYYYDTDTGWYYLQSRYYDPIIKRFLNADNLLSNFPTVISCNLFAYCANNPVSNTDPQGNCYYDSHGVWKHEYWEWEPGYVRLPEPGNVGAAKPYTEIGTSNGNRNSNPNCYSYALGYYDKSYDPGEIAGVMYYRNIESVASCVERDMNALGRGCRRLYGCDFSVADNEYRVALRVSPVNQKIDFRTGTQYVDWDYHFMVQTDTGGWAEKHGPGGPTVYHPSGTPDTISWDCGEDKGYYQGAIVYFAFTD